MTSLGQLNRGFRPYAAALLTVARAITPAARITSTRRSRAVQAALYLRYKAGLSRYPAAAPGNSMHERGLAVDLGGLSQPQLEWLGQLWESWGGRWGGRFSHPDAIHFEA